MYVHSTGRPLPASRRDVPAEAGAGRAPGSAPRSNNASRIDCLHAALWYERSRLEALAAALSGPPGSDDVLTSLRRERGMARLLSSVETAALAAELGPLPQSCDQATVLGGGWASVMDERDVASRRLVEQVDAVAASTHQSSETPSLDCSPLDNASEEQAG